MANNKGLLGFVGGGVAVLSLFLPWYGVFGISIGALDAEFLAWGGALLGGAGGVLGGIAGSPGITSNRRGLAISGLAVSAIGALLILRRFMTESMFVQYGLWIGLGGALLGIVAGAMQLSGAEISTPHRPAPPAAPPAANAKARPAYLAPPAPAYVDEPSTIDWLPEGIVPANPGVRLGSWLLDFVLSIVTLGVGWLIWAATLADAGQTPAKKMLGLRVIDIGTRRPASFSTMLFMRGIVGGFVASFAFLFTIGVLAFMPLWDRNRQNIWDKVSGTVVCADPPVAWSPR